MYMHVLRNFSIRIDIVHIYIIYSNTYNRMYMRVMYK